MTNAQWSAAAALVLLSVLSGSAQTRKSQAAKVTAGKQPEAAAILDRYVEVTGGAAAYRKINSAIFEMTVRTAGTTAAITVFQARDGRIRTVTEADGKTVEKGVTKGMAWEYSSVTGARLLKGKEAEKELASAAAFMDDTWRQQFPTVLWKGVEMIDGKTCDRIGLTRTDGQARERFFDRATGLETRNLTYESGEPLPLQEDIISYETARGIRYPAVLRLAKKGVTMNVKVESASFDARPPSDAFVLPQAVIKAMAEPSGVGGLPNPVDLLEKYLDKTGGKGAYQAVRTQRITADLTFAMAGLKARMVAYSGTGGKAHMVLDMPGAGKFESGSDGSTGWERSVLMGPRLAPRSEVMTGMIGPQPDQFLRMLNAYESVETVGKEEANGAPCYAIRTIAKGDEENPGTMCFDVQTGLLTKVTGKTKTQMGTVPLDLTLSQYRDEAGVRMPHHMESTISGQPVKIDITEVAVNEPMPDGIFDLPKEIIALKAKRAAGVESPAETTPDRPTLRRAK